LYDHLNERVWCRDHEYRRYPYAIDEFGYCLHGYNDFGPRYVFDDWGNRLYCFEEHYEFVKPMYHRVEKIEKTVYYQNLETKKNLKNKYFEEEVVVDYDYPWYPEGVIGYDDHGFPIYEEVTRFDKHGFPIKEEVITRYDDHGFPVVVDDHGFPIREEKWFYDDFGRAIWGYDDWGYPIYVEEKYLYPVEEIIREEVIVPVYEREYLGTAYFGMVFELPMYGSKGEELVYPTEFVEKRLY